MKKLLICVLALILAGCASQTKLTASKDDMTQSQKDEFECGLQARSYFGIRSSTMFIAVGDVADQINKIYGFCMESRGYTITEVQPPPQSQPIERKER